MNNLFISYASEDQAVAMEICALLEAQDVACWIAPRDVAPGAKWDEAIVDAITSAGAFLLILTSAANESPYVGNEVNHAFAAKKPIFTFRVEDVQPNKSIGFYLARHHWTDGFAKPLDQTVPQLTVAVTALLGASESAGVAGVRAGPKAGRAVGRNRWRPPPSFRRALALGAVALAGAAAAWLAKPAPAVPQMPTARFNYSMPSDRAFRNTGRPVLAISADGRQFLYNARDGVYVRSMDALTDTLVPGTEENLTSPFFSPDGMWIGFWSGDMRLKKIPVTGGTPVVLATVPQNPYGVTWADDDTILFGQQEGIMRVSAGGGTPELLVAPREKGEQLFAPQMLPGGDWLLFSTARGVGDNRWDVGEIVAESIESGERKVLWRGGSDARYVQPGHLVYAVGHELFAVRFDPDHMAVTGPPVMLLENLQRAPVPSQQTGTAQYAVSANGALVHVPDAAAAAAVESRSLVWVDRRGAEESLGLPARYYSSPRVSPDGANIALDIRDAMNDVWIWSTVRRTFTRLTFGEGADRTPVWSSDGRRIIFHSQGNDASRPGNLYWQAADGSGIPERLTEDTQTQYPTSVSADGRYLLFFQLRGGSLLGSDVFVLDMSAGRRVRPLLADSYGEGNAELSPDGRWVAYESFESGPGEEEVYVRTFADPNAGRRQISPSGGNSPMWSKDGRELFYVDPAGAIVGVLIRESPTFESGPPQVVVPSGFATVLMGYTTGRQYDVSRDGKRFLVIKTADAVGPAVREARQITVVQNWIEEVKRLVPGN